MAATINLRADADYGHTGQYVARITGRNSKYTFEREFVGRKFGKRNECTEAMVDDPGVYELRKATRKGKDDRYVLVVHVKDEQRRELGLEEKAGPLIKLVSDKEDAILIAKAMDGGRKLEEIVRLVKSDTAGQAAYEIMGAKEAERAEVAATVDEAVDMCWSAIQALPEKQMKAVLKELRERSANLSRRASNVAAMEYAGGEAKPADA